MSLALTAARSAAAITSRRSPSPRFASALYIKVHVSLPSGVSVVVLMSKGDLEALKVEPGDPVAVDVVDAKVFVQSYSI